MDKTLTELIMETTAPYNNPYQGTDKKVLFVCSAGLLRSATAARIFADKYNTRAAGSASYALIPISPNLIAWADEIVFMKWTNRVEALEKFPALKEKKLVELDVPDEYEHMDPELIRILKEQYD